MSINLSSLPESLAGYQLFLNTWANVCTEIVNPEWASSCYVGGFNGISVFVIESPVINDGTPVLLANPLLQIYDVDDSSERVVALGDIKVCSSQQMSELEEGTEPDGAFFWIRFAN